MTRRRLAVAALAAAGAVAATTAALALRGGGDDGPLVVSVRMDGVTEAADVATGFGVGPERVVTVAHVLAPRQRVVVQAQGQRARRGWVLKTSRADDVAVIAVPGLAAPRMRTADRAADGMRLLLRRPEGVRAVPSPVRRRVTATVRGPGSGPYSREALELGARVRPGDSGAPVVDGEGAVAGMLFARSDDRPGTAWAVDATEIRALIANAR